MAVRKGAGGREKLLALLVVLLVALILGNVLIRLPDFTPDTTQKDQTDALLLTLDSTLKDATHIAIQSAENPRPYDHNIYLAKGNLYLDGTLLYDKKDHDNQSIRLTIMGEGTTFSVRVEYVDEAGGVTYAQDAVFHANELKLLRRTIEGSVGEEISRPVISFTRELLDQ